MTLDLAALAQRPTNQIAGFGEKILQLIPSLAKHPCAASTTGHFLSPLQEGTLMGHVIEHLALELQNLAGMQVGFGQTRSTKQSGIYEIVFEYTEVNAGLYAAEAAVRLAKSLSLGHTLVDLTNELDIQVQTLRRIKRKQGLSPSTASVVNEAERRGIPWKRLDQDALVMLGHGINQQRIANGLSGRTSALGIEIACNKQKTKALLASAYIPVAASRLVCEEGGLKKAIQTIGFPLAIYPVEKKNEQGISLNITDWKEATLALKRAKQASETVVVEKYIVGFSFRLLMINNRLVAAARRSTATVTGNGRSTIQQLIELANQAPGRGHAYENNLTFIQIDEATTRMLQAKALTLQSVLPVGETLYLKPAASLSSGGTASDVTDKVHPLNVALAERVARRMGLDICGIDIIATSLETPIAANGGAVIAIQPAPNFRMHLAPTEGQPRNVAAAVLDMLFPDNKASIPTVAITGTNEKTITTRLAAHIAQTASYRVGCATSEGIYLDNTIVTAGNCTDAASTSYVLQEPSVAFAVLECAHEEIIDAGLGFRQCHVAIVTNLVADSNHQDIYSPEQIARAQWVVAESVAPQGFAILNADDDQVYAMAEKLTCQIALFGLTNHARLQNHCAHGRIAAFVADGYVMISDGTQQHQLAQVENIPLAFGNNVSGMLQQVLPAVLAAYVQSMDCQTIRLALYTFMPSREQMHSQMNLFQFRQFQVLIDNAHNPSGLAAIGQYLSTTHASPKIGLISAINDYCEDDLIQLGKLAGQLFDEVVIRHDKRLWSSKDQEMVMLLLEGIQQSDPHKPVKVIPDEEQAIHYLIDSALPGSIITLCCNNVLATVEMVRKHQSQEDKNELAPDVAQEV